MQSLPVLRIGNYVGPVLLLTAMAARVSGCAVCIGFPERTTADYLIEADCVVLACQRNDNRFQYAPRETLKGRFDGSDINLLVDSATRRVLQSDSHLHVVLVQNKPGGEWRSLGIAREEYLKVVRRILMFSASWNGSDGNMERIRFFLPLFGHKDRRIRELAYLELGRAPYSVIKQLGRVAPREYYAAMLEHREYLKWRSLAILLLAQSDDPTDKQRILDSFHAAHQFGLTTNLAAWTAAAIEVEGVTALRFIEEQYLCRADRTVEERRAVLVALSTLGAGGDADLQNRIIRSYRVLLARSPEFAPRVADDLRDWKRTDLRAELSSILHGTTKLDASGRRSIRSYLLEASTVGDLAVVDE